MRAEGPFFDELTVGQVFPPAPGLTLTDGLAAAHQAIVGNRLALSLDGELARAVTGGDRPASPALVWDVAIGQSTVATRNVKANLFYRGLWFRRVPVIGDTLRTSTAVAALRQNRSRPGRAPTGLAALRITTVDQQNRPVLDFWRGAMLPLRDPAGSTGHDDDVGRAGAEAREADLAGLTGSWNLEAFAGSGPGAPALAPGDVIEVAGGDVVSSAPELARLTLNVAQVHHDAAAAGGSRLVYGGHTIGLALTQAARALPSLVTVAGWHSCDHLAPVREGDTLHSTIEVESLAPRPGGAVAGLRSRVFSSAAPGAEQVLDWRFVAILA
ncbi:MAG TPA: MaoC family dehydratase [Streptosporangiaceae bacterium]